MHRQNSVYRIVERNGQENAKMVLPMEGNSVCACDVEKALNECEFASRAFVNMSKCRLEFDLGTQKNVCRTKKQDTHNLNFCPNLLSNADLADVEHVAHEIIQASTTGVIPRMELECESSSFCDLFACNANCIFDHNLLCENLNPSLLTYNFNTKEIMYRVQLSATNKQKRRKKND